jgi:hypothetical protein
MPIGIVLKALADIVPWTYLLIVIGVILVGEAMGIPLASGIIGWVQAFVDGVIDWIVNEFIGGAVPW